MINLSYPFLLIWIFIILKRAFPLPITIPEKSKEEEEIVPKNFIPESNVIEETSAEPPVFIMVPVLADRARRGIYDEGNVNFDNISYEVPTFIKFNESSKGGIEVSLVPSPEMSNQQQMENAIATGNGGPNGNCCPPQKSATYNGCNGLPPICLTIAIDNLFPPGKSNRIVISNSSEIRGTGAILKVSFVDTKTTPCPTDFYVAAYDTSTTQERLESIKKKKGEEEDEEDEDGATTQIVDQKALQEIILKILTGSRNGSTTLPPDDEVFFENTTSETSFSFVINPSLFHKISGKFGSISTTRRPTTSKIVNPPDFDSLLKAVEHITSSIPKEKLLSLLSNLINKATLNKEVSSNQ